MVWLAVTRPDMPRRIVSAAITSTKREWSSSVSSQWMSTRRPCSSARAIANLHRLHAVLAGQLVMRDPADDIRAQLDGLAHQLPAAFESRGCPAAGTPRAAGRSGPRTSSRRSTSARSARSCGSQTSTWLRTCWTPLASCQRRICRTRDCTSSYGQVGDPLGPYRDALEQRAGHVRPRLADGQDGVKMDVRLDQGRRDQAPGQVEDLGRGRASIHGNDPAVVDPQIGERGLARHAGIAED